MTNEVIKTEQEEYDELMEKLQKEPSFRGAMSKIMQEDFFSYVVTMFFLFNGTRMMLKDFHRIVIKKLDDLVKGKNTKRNLCLSLPVGCLSGDTSIEARVTKNNITFDTYFDIAILAKTKFDSIQVRSLTDKDTIIWQDCEVVQSGVQKVSKLRISDGEGVRSIKATETHKFMLNNGVWKELKDLKIGDEINVGYKPELTWEWKVIEIQKDIDECETFDIICPTYHNYIANGMVVHNSGKSLITQFFISWCFARTPNNAFVYTSHSEDLITKMSNEIRAICTHPAWVLLFGHVLKKDDRQKTKFSFEGARNRTGMVAKAINSAITGLDCFDYNELIWTEKGAIKIGELVEKKLDVKVWSYNLKNKKFELKPIERYIKKEKSTFIKITFDDGTIIKCTPTHKFYTDKGYVEAQSLTSDMMLFSNSLNNRPANIKFFFNDFFRNSSIANKFNFFIGKMFFIVNFWSNCFNNITHSNILPIFTSFDRSNMSCADTVFSSNFFGGSSIFCNSESFFSGKFKRVLRVVSTTKSSTMSNGVFHIFRPSAVFQVFKTIICSCAVKMSNFNPFHLMSNKSPHNKSMNVDFNTLIPFVQSNSRISIGTCIRFQNSTFISMITALLKNLSSKTSNSTFVRYFIKIFKRWNWFPNFISCVFHKNTSYCVTVQDNNNLFISKSQILASNCGVPSVNGFSGALVLDDVLDAGNAIYEIERENSIRVYNEKLATRRRTPTTPTILIMQRLHPEDLAGWVERNQPDLWDIVKVPALDENGNSFWEERYPKAELEMLRDRQPEMFQAQYQQQPIVRGGQLIKTNWFNFYSEHPRYEQIFIVADTAQTVKEYSDYSVFMVWGKYNNNLYLIDMIHERLEIPDLIKRAKEVTNKYKIWQNYLRLSFLAIEDKSSGTALIQQLRRETITPILPYKVKKKDKVTRVKDILYYIEAGRIFLPFNRDYSFVPIFLAETEMFDAMGTAKHDDIVDVLTMGIKYGLVGEGCSIFD